MRTSNYLATLLLLLGCACAHVDAPPVSEEAILRAALVQAIPAMGALPVRDSAEYVLVSRYASRETSESRWLRSRLGEVRRELEISSRCVAGLFSDSRMEVPLPLEGLTEFRPFDGEHDPFSILQSEVSWRRVYPGGVGVATLSRPAVCDAGTAIVLISLFPDPGPGRLSEFGLMLAKLSRADDGRWVANGYAVVM